MYLHPDRERGRREEMRETKQGLLLLRIVTQPCFNLKQKTQLSSGWVLGEVSVSGWIWRQINVYFF
jgi:hypothetical protein